MIGVLSGFFTFANCPQGAPCKAFAFALVRWRAVAIAAKAGIKAGYISALGNTRYAPYRFSNTTGEAW